ncbi:hypothetical protein Cgig2_025572 [Carnegiea gigantea]|uniref:Endonuclease/exonuclease/phosphatase domain-containing protein n=1 Tax=Carnegiea gigantea TaxID=171969 RepID=A0A9Q1JXI5_9CARY|nr:hypothetical protein Cgig2_025572 [Carnegiea gigantea]
MENVKKKLKDFDGVATNTRRHSGGVTLLGKKRLDVSLMSISLNLVDVTAKNVRCLREWRFTDIYVYPETHNKYKTCDLLKDLNEHPNLPWLVGGDINETFFNFGRKDSRVGICTLRSYRHQAKRYDLVRNKSMAPQTGNSLAPMISRAHWLIGNRHNILVWSDPWLPRPYSLKLVQTMASSSPPWKVANLIDYDSESIVKASFIPYDTKLIISIPLYPTSLKAIESNSSSANKVPNPWSKLWTLNIPPRIKIFEWKMSVGALATHYI